MGEEEPAQKFAAGLVALLKEYAEKVRERIPEVKQAREAARARKVQVHATPEGRALLNEFEALQPALLGITREASQLAEQGKVNDLTRVELKVRRAEVEGLLDSYQTLLKQA